MLLADCELLIDEAPILVECKTCGARTQPSSIQCIQCGQCESSAVEVCYGAGTRGDRFGDRIMKNHTRLVEARTKILKQNDVVARSLREQFHQAKFQWSVWFRVRVRETAFLEASLRAAEKFSRGSARGRLGYGQRRPAIGARMCRLSKSLRERFAI
jgi:hypothetical protein